jgi:hypothetical protein
MADVSIHTETNDWLSARQSHLDKLKIAHNGDGGINEVLGNDEVIANGDQRESPFRNELVLNTAFFEVEPDPYKDLPDGRYGKIKNDEVENEIRKRIQAPEQVKDIIPYEVQNNILESARRGRQVRLKRRVDILAHKQRELNEVGTEFNDLIYRLLDTDPDLKTNSGA